MYSNFRHPFILPCVLGSWNVQQPKIACSLYGFWSYGGGRMVEVETGICNFRILSSLFGVEELRLYSDSISSLHFLTRKKYSRWLVVVVR